MVVVVVVIVVIVNASRNPPGPGVWQEADHTIAHSLHVEQAEYVDIQIAATQ